MQSRCITGVRKVVLAFAATVMFSLVTSGLRGVSAAAVIPDGTVMVSTGSGLVSKFDPNGTFLGQLDTGTGSIELDGSGFDATGNFLATAGFFANQVVK